MKKIGIITSGGDCGGLNAVVKGAAQMANNFGISSYVIPNGYAGLYNLLDFDHLVELNEMRADEIGANLAGSEAGHSRVKIRKIDNEMKYERIKDGLKKFDIDSLIISGGDDTGSVVVDLLDQGINCIHCPKTMDLDLQTYSVGADSTISRIAEFAEELRTTATTHNRIIVMDVFGRYAGHTAFRGGIAAEADAILIPEIPVDFDVLYDHIKDRYFKRVLNDDVNAGSYLIVVAEGLKNADGSELVDETAGPDSFGHKKLAGAAKYVSQEINRRLKEDPEVKKLMKETKMFVDGLYEIPEVRTVSPGHLVRCGHSSAYDVNFGKEAGAAAVLLLKNNISGVTIVGIEGKEVKYMPTKQAIEQRHVDSDQVAFHENMGTCFGRKKMDISPSFKEVAGHVQRHL